MNTTCSALFIIALLFLSACVNQPASTDMPIDDLAKQAESNLYSDNCSNTGELKNNLQLYSSPAAAYFVAACLQREPSTAGRYSKALSLLQYSAKNDYPDAVFQLSQTFSNGYGVEIDLLTALDWQRKFDSLSKLNDARPVMLINEGKTTQPKILQSLEEKATAGDAEVQYLLAQAYDKGQWGDVNIERAIYWYTTSAKNGNKSANFILGYFYCRGANVEKNKTLSNQYLKDSSRNVHCK